MVLKLLVNSNFSGDHLCQNMPHVSAFEHDAQPVRLPVRIAAFHEAAERPNIRTFPISITTGNQFLLVIFIVTQKVSSTRIVFQMLMSAKIS